MSTPARDITVADGLPLPRELVTLIEVGAWPNAEGLSSEERHALYWHQHSHPLVHKERVQTFAPDENLIVLLSPPFATIQRWLEWERSSPEGHGSFWQMFGALDEIEPKLTVMLCDFELGSDSCVALDYRQGLNDPSVIRLKWFQATERLANGRWKPNTHWVTVAPTFAAFAEMLGLTLSERR